MVSQRHLWLGVALVVTLVAVVVDFPAPPEEPGAGSRPQVRPAAPVMAGAPALPAPTLTGRTPWPAGRTDLFVARNWQPPPAPAPAAPPVAPTAPALPFAYLGKLLDGTEVLAFVSQGGVTRILRKGDTLQDYRVEAITQSAATFVYLPLDQRQTLNFGSAN